jgi:hypothetical protein
LYAIIQIRVKATGKELTCIAISSKESVLCHPIGILKEIESEFENLGYL